VPFLDMAANQAILGDKLVQLMKLAFTAFGLELNQFVIENISLPDELQKILDQRIGMKMVGDLGSFTQFTAAEAMGAAASNTNETAGLGMGLGAGATVAQVMAGSVKSGAAQSAPADDQSREPPSSASRAATLFQSAQSPAKNADARSKRQRSQIALAAG
jgi:membrane protease subunit (stomatin/prohibitin family)